MPMRASSPSASTASRIASAARVARSRVVLVRLRNAERGENGVAGELLDDAAVQRDAVGDRLEELVDAAPHDLGIGARDDARRVDEVHEQDRRELSLHT